MPRATWSPEPDCGIAHALGVVGDWWTLLILRDIARGYDRFDALATELRISRRVLSERLENLVATEVLTRVPPDARRHRYALTERGRALLPVLVALQDWGDRFVLGDGSVLATATQPQERRVADLVGTSVPASIDLPASHDGETELADIVSPDAAATVIFTYPATSRPSRMPDGWSDIAGTAGCTLENRLFRDRHPDFAAAGVAVHGLSTQRPDEQRSFAEAEDIPFPLYSDEHQLASAALRLPVFRVADTIRLKRMVLVVAANRSIAAARFPVTDIPGAVEWALAEGRTLAGTAHRPASLSPRLVR
jgi:DNA-binding HxlR family transcriptional regulator/peroxiredoxin